MSEDLERLKEIGAQKIYEKTHIALKYVQSILYESFEGLSRVQFLGFVSIIEREYNLQLDELKACGLEYFDTLAKNTKEGESVFITPKRTNRFTYLYVVFAIGIFVMVAFFSLEKKKNIPISEENIVKEKETIPKSVVLELVPPLEQNISVDIEKQLDTNITVPSSVIIPPAKEKKIVLHSLKIEPKSRLWIGYINFKTAKKKQTVIIKSLDLDPKTEWLLSLGHGNVDIVIDGKVQTFHSTKSMRFLYSDGELKQLSIAEFKKLNKGRLW